MNQWKRFTSLIILALWASCMIRCDAAQLFAGDPLLCCGETTNDCSGEPASPVHCVCHVAKSEGYVSASCRVQVPPAIQCVLFALVVTPEPPLADTYFCSDDLIHPPPELAAGWQFVSKAAAPPRAPSFLS